MSDGFSPNLLITNMPKQTKTSAIRVNQLNSCSLSPRIIAENSAPKSGFVLLNTATLETGLYLRRKPCNVKAQAERNARYQSRNAAPASMCGIVPPAHNPMIIKTIPPIKNW